MSVGDARLLRAEPSVACNDGGWLGLGVLGGLGTGMLPRLEHGDSLRAALTHPLPNPGSVLLLWLPTPLLRSHTLGAQDGDARARGGPQWRIQQLIARAAAAAQLQR